MKKLLSFLLAAALVVTSCAAVSAADGSVTASYDPNGGTVTLAGNVGSEPNAPVTVVITDNDDDPSDTNQPVAAYVIFTGNGGEISDRHSFVNVLPSGVLNVMLTADGGSAQAEILVFSESDEGTKAVLAEINKATSAADLAAYLAQNNNIEKLGFLYDDTKDYLTTVSSFLVAKRAEKKSDLTLNETVGSIHFALFLCEVKGGAVIDDSVRKHSAGLDCDYADYTALSDGIKTEFANLLSKVDYISLKKQVILKEFASVCKARIAAASWSDLKDLLTAAPDEYSINIGSGSNYDKITVTNRQNVFYNMLSDAANAAFVSDISSAFEREAAAVLANQNSSNSNSSSSGGGGGGSKRSDSSGAITYPPVTPVQPTDDTKPTYTDTENHFSKDAVDALSAKGIVNGYPDGTFAPDNQVTRAEFAAMICKLLGISTDESGVFADVAADDWFSGAVNALGSKGVITGYNSEFRPNDNISRQDAAVILKRVLTLKGASAADGAQSFDDGAEISDYAADSVADLAARGVIKGYNGIFRPLDTVTRGEAAVMIYRILD